MKKIIVAAILGLTACAEDDRVRCEDIDAGILDTDAGTDAGCVYTEIIAFPDMLVNFER